MEEDDSSQIKANQVCNILSHGIDDLIFISIITDKNEMDPYASDSMLSIFQVWNKWEDIQFKNNMNKYISAMLESLSEFSSIGIKIPDKIISCGIIGRITKKRPLLMQTLFSDIEALSKPKMIIAKLRDIGRHKKAMRKQIVSKKSSNSTALATNVKHKPKTIHLCKHGKHNPSASHPESECWTLFPEKREEQRAAKRARPLTYHTTTGEKEHDLSSIKPAFAYNTTQSLHSKLPTVLDSGASNHMINTLELFVDTTPTQISILTGGGAGELTAVARGTAKY
jgi:hypothetical protein